MRCAVALVALSSLVLSSSEASAQHRRRRHRERGEQAPPADPIEALCAEGVAMLDRQDYAGAASFFDALYQRTREPRVLYRRGVAELELSRFVDAERDIRTAMQSANDPWIAAHREGVERALQRAQLRVGDLTVVTSAPGATVTVNGDEVRSFPVRVAAGQARIAVRAPGHENYETTVMVPGNVTQVFRHEVTLRPVAEAPTPTVTATNPVTPPVVEPTPAPAPPPAATSSSSPLRPVGVGLMVAGGVGLALGVVGMALREGAVSDFDANGACGANGGAPVGGDACVSAYDSIQTWQAVSIAGFVGGGVLAASGAVLFFLSPRSRSAERASVAPSIGPGSMGLTVSGRF